MEEEGSPARCWPLCKSWTPKEAKDDSQPRHSSHFELWPSMFFWPKAQRRVKWLGGQWSLIDSGADQKEGGGGSTNPAETSLASPKLGLVAPDNFHNRWEAWNQISHFSMIWVQQGLSKSLFVEDGCSASQLQEINIIWKRRFSERNPNDTCVTPGSYLWMSSLEVSSKIAK